MSEIRVHAQLLSDAAHSVEAIAPEVSDLAGRAHHHAHAAAGTRAAQGMSDLAEHWSAVLPGFAAAGGGLARALAGAAADYVASDDRVAGAAAGSPGANVAGAGHSAAGGAPV